MVKEDTFTTYFSLFQLNMQRGQIIPNEMVEKYKDDITFVFTIDKCFMEAIVPRKIRFDNSAMKSLKK